jgi:predicted RNA polymerase sigma factor
MHLLAEIARALLTTDANVQKRIERARDRLRELDVDFETPAAAQLCARLDAVLAVVSASWVATPAPKRSGLVIARRLESSVLSPFMAMDW